MFTKGQIYFKIFSKGFTLYKNSFLLNVFTTTDKTIFTVLLKQVSWKADEMSRMAANPMFSSLQDALLVECSKEIEPYSLYSSFTFGDGLIHKDQELRVNNFTLYLGIKW